MGGGGGVWPSLPTMIFPVVIYLFKVNDINTRARREICSKLTIKTPERRHWRRFGVFIVNFEHILHLALVFLLLNLNMQLPVGFSVINMMNDEWWSYFSPISSKYFQYSSELYLEPSGKSTIELFYITKNSIVDFQLGSKYASPIDTNWIN